MAAGTGPSLLKLSAAVRRRAASCALCACLCGLTAGCGVDLDYTEFKRIDEKVTESELQQFLRVIDALPDKKLPKIEQVFAPLPSWSPSRTLPVKELANEEKKRLDQRWSVEAISRQLEEDRVLQRALRREKLTVEQFVGLALTLGAALAKSTLRDQQNLDQVIDKARRRIMQISQDERSFSKLKREAQYSILRQAGSLTRMDRAKRLNEVPPENVALVRRHMEKLKKVFPDYFTQNPLDAVADLLEERGMPFEEMKESGFDAEISWDRENAVIGTDDPDPSPADGAPRPLNHRGGVRVPYRHEPSNLDSGR